VVDGRLSHLMSLATDQCGVTVLRCIGDASATKRWVWRPALGEWSKISYNAGARFRPEERVAGSLADLVSVLDDVRRDPRAFLVRGALAPWAQEQLANDADLLVKRQKLVKAGRGEPSLIEVPRRWIMVDIDDFPLLDNEDLLDDPEWPIDRAIRELLPPAFHEATCWWQLSSSAGFAPGLKAHIFFWLATPATNEHIRAVLEQHAPGVDRSPYNAAQPHYIADPTIEGRHDPLPRRTGWRIGEDDEVVLPGLIPGWRKPRPAKRVGSDIAGNGGGIDDALDLLGDGEGLEGFHAPLRTATMRYAKQCSRHDSRNDDDLKKRIREAVHAAPRKASRDDWKTYLGDDYLDRLIDGAFALLSAEPDMRTMQPHHAVPRQTVQQARDAIAEHVSAFLGRAVDWHRSGEAAQAAEHAALVVGVGVGKSKAAREAMAGFIAAARAAEGDLPHRVLWLVPTHRLGNETLAAMEDLGLSVAVMRGREAKVPVTDILGDDEDPPEPLPMCLNLPAVEDAISIGHDVESSVCGSGKEGEPICPHRDQCEYQKQKRAVAGADVVIAAHQALFHRIPKQATDGVGLVIADESWWQAGILPNREIRLSSFADEPLLHPVLQRGDFRGTGDSRSWRMITADEATNDLNALSARAQAAFDATPEGELVSRDAVISAGLTVADCAEAAKLEWQRKVENAIRPGMSLEARAEGVARAAGNASIPRRAGVWKALGELLAGDATHTGRLEMSSKASAEGADRVVLLHSRADVIEAVAALPILALDATMPAEVVKHYLPSLNVLADVQPAAPHMTVNQIVGGWGKTSLIPSGRAAVDENRRRTELGAELLDFVRLNSGGNGLVITYQDLESRFAEPGIRTGHFNAIAGLDTFGDVRSLFVIGRPLPAPAELLTMARALTGLPITPEAGQMETRGVLMADGTGTPINVRVYADPTLEALRVAITDAEVIQAIGRGRGVNRTADNPLDVFVLADVVLPLPVSRVARWADVRPDVIGRMLGRGAALTGPADAAKAYPDLFPNPDAARKAISRAAETKSIRTNPYGVLFIGKCPDALPIQVSYRPQGNGQKTRRALVPGARLPSLRGWLEGLLGPLAHYSPELQTAPSPSNQHQEAQLPRPLAIPGASDDELEPPPAMVSLATDDFGGLVPPSGMLTCVAGQGRPLDVTL
jgi:hypothetical protein